MHALKFLRNMLAFGARVTFGWLQESTAIFVGGRKLWKVGGMPVRSLTSVASGRCVRNEDAVERKISLKHRSDCHYMGGLDAMHRLTVKWLLLFRRCRNRLVSLPRRAMELIRAVEERPHRW